MVFHVYLKMGNKNRMYRRNFASILRMYVLPFLGGGENIGMSFGIAFVFHFSIKNKIGLRKLTWCDDVGEAGESGGD